MDIFHLTMGAFICYYNYFTGCAFRSATLPINRSNTAIAISDHDGRYCRINSDMVDLVTEVNG
jgi:hypothetical protein